MHYWRGVLTHATFVLAQPTYLAVRYLVNPNHFNSIHALWFAITAIIWTYIITQVSIPFVTSPLRGLPSPPNEKWILCHLDFNNGKPPTENLANMFKNTPNDGLMVLWFPLYTSCEVVPTKPELVMDVLNSYSYDWEKSPSSKKLLRRILGDGLVTTDGNTHKAMRKAVAPAFSGHHIRDLVPLFYSKGTAFADSLAHEAAQSADGSLEVMARWSRVALDIIGAAGLGDDFNTVKNNENRLANLYDSIINADRSPLALYIFLTMMTPPWFVRNLRGTKFARLVDTEGQLRNEARKLVQEKKRMVSDKMEQQKDIMAIIMRSGDFSDDYLTDQLLTFLAAGHDTTAAALAWTTWLLAKHPHIQDRLRAECNARLAKKSNSKVNASDFDTENMPYLAAVCNETLRLYPPVPVVTRTSAKETKIGPFVIPQGIECFISIWALNRNPEIWGADAEEYNPDRWLNGPNAANGGAKNPNAFTTFIHGPRSCIGQSFARMEMKCLLAAVVMRFSMEVSDPSEKVEIGGFLTIKPVNGLRLRLHDLRAGDGQK